MRRNHRAVNTIGLAHGRRQRHAGSTQSESGGGTRRRANDEAFAVVLDLGLRQRVEIGNDLGPGACAIERCDAALQGFPEHGCEEAAEHVTADGLVELMEDRPRREQVLGGVEGLLHGPQLLVAKHGCEWVEVGVGAQHENAVEPLLLFNVCSIDREVLLADRLHIAAVADIADERLAAPLELPLSPATIEARSAASFSAS